MWIAISIVIVLSIAMIMLSNISRLRGKDKEAKFNAEQDLETVSNYEKTDSAPPVPNPFDQLRKKD